MGVEPIGVGFLGVGHSVHAGSYASALTGMDGVRMAGVYDEDPAGGRAFACKLGLPYYSDFEGLLVREDMQAVVVCSQTDTHAHLTIAAARRGKHVLCEKPIATSLADGQAMVEACRTAGVQFHVAYTGRFYPMVQEAKRIIASGEIGTVVGARGGNRGGPPLPAYGDHPGWLVDMARAGGGALIDHSVHVTDALRYVLDDEAERVYAETGTLLHEDLSVEDCAVLLIRFRGGTAASVDPSWSLPAANPYTYDFYLHLVGTQGTLTLDDTRQAVRVARDGPAGRPVFDEPFGMNIDAELVKAFVRSIRQGEVLPPCATGEDGLRSLEIALAGYESARTGQPVVLRGA